jgi:hypothetical protein
VQTNTGTGTGTEIFFSLPVRKIATGSGIFYSFTGTCYLSEFRNFVIVSLFLTAIKNSIGVQISAIQS